MPAFKNLLRRVEKIIMDAQDGRKERYTISLWPGLPMSDKARSARLSKEGAAFALFPLFSDQLRWSCRKGHNAQSLSSF